MKRLIGWRERSFSSRHADRHRPAQPFWLRRADQRRKAGRDDNGQVARRSPPL